MTRMRMVIGLELPREVGELFRREFAVTDCAGADLIRAAETHSPDVLLCSIGGPRIDAPAIERLSAAGVRAVATYSVGLDHIDVAAAQRAGLAILNTPGVLADSVADAAMLLMLGAARRVTESIALVRSGAWDGWSPTQLNGTELRGKLLGILGMGEIGRRVARRAEAFGMSIAYSNRRAAADCGSARFAPVPEQLIGEADVLLLAWPSTPETRRFIDRRTLRLAKPSLILVNIGRGDLVDDEALIAALSDGTLRGAGLDVFDGEPHIHPGYRTLPNLFMLPHIGSSTVEARLAMGRALIDGLLAWSSGSRPYNLVEAGRAE